MQTLSFRKTYKKYHEYKDSGLKWLEKYPADWNILPVRGILNERKEKNITGNVDNILSVMKDVGVIRYADKGSVGNNSSDRPENYKIVRKDDIVINSMNLVIGSVGIANEDGVTSSVYIIYNLKNKNNDIRYFYDLFRAKSFQRHLGSYGKGIMELRESIKTQDIKNQLIPIPPAETQEKISNYLDEKISFIDKVIEKKKKLIELLKEKRTAIINQAVTKGLDPKVELVDSGIDWIGKIPKGWSVKRIKSMCIVKRGASPRPIDDPKYFSEDGEYSWVRIADATKSKKYLLNTKEKLSELGKSLSVPLDPGELIISIAATVGKPIINKIKCCIHDGFVYLKDFNIDKEYAYYIFEGGEAYKGLGKMGTQLNLNTNTIGSMFIPVPPKEEQEKISKYISSKNIIADDIIQKIEFSLAKLLEFKASLISNVVTGKAKI